MLIHFNFLGSFLAQFDDFGDYERFFNKYLKNSAVNEYCAHGGRYMLWLPYKGFDGNTENVTYFGKEEPMKMKNAWRRSYPKTSQRPWCVIARLGNQISSSNKCYWVKFHNSYSLILVSHKVGQQTRIW